MNFSPNLAAERGRPWIWRGLLLLCLLCPPDLRASEPAGETTESPGSNAPVAIHTTAAATNSESEIPTDALPKPTPSVETAHETTPAEKEKALQQRLELARNFRLTRLATKAEPILVELLQEGNSEVIQQSALLELALCAQEQNDLPRAQQIYSQFLSRWPNDPHTPEILLRQGQFFRQMGMNSLALAKFYSVMTAALALKNDRLDYYKRLVVLAQTEIAETHYQTGKYADAAEYFARLLKQNSPLLNRPQAQYRLLHALSEIGRHDEAVGQAQDFLVRYPDAADLAEVRFTLARSLKELGRNNEALQQVLALLQEQKSRTADRPEVWAYWQQRAGNEIANQLYREGDYTRALDVYSSLAQLDRAPTWQIPVNYQIGMTYERLQQPQLASQTYSNIVSRELECSTNATPGLKSVFAMARWRINFLNWQAHAEKSTRELTPPPRESAAAIDSKTL
jgi:tetratricopeptide (TPR) repeat protein